MSYPKVIEVCHAELFTKEFGMRDHYPQALVDKVLRVRLCCRVVASYAWKHKDRKTMERAATAYDKLNRVDLEDEQAIPHDQILVQPFTATDDPRVPDIEPLPNIRSKIDAMIEKYRRETFDIEDVEFEECDPELDTLFPSDNTSEECDDATENY